MTAPSKVLKSCLETCNKTNKLADRVSVLMLQYLTTVKQVSASLDRLAHGHLDVSQILIAITAGLDERGETSKGLPKELLVELEKKVRATSSELTMIEHSLEKSLEYERKGAMGKMRRGFGKIFGEGDFEKLVIALAKTKEILQLSALMFEWSVGSDKVDDIMGIGYAGLAAALDRLDHKSQPKTSNRSAANLIVEPTPHHGNGSFSLSSPVSPPPTVSDRTIASTHRHDYDHHQHHQHQHQHLHNSQQYPPQARDPYHLSHPPGHPPDFPLYSASGSSSYGLAERSPSSPHQGSEHAALSEETMSQSSAAFSDDVLYEVGGQKIDPSQPLRLEVNPTKMPRWVPRNQSDESSTAHVDTLLSAIRGKNHKLIEQLLDRGVSPNLALGTCPLIEAIKMLDAESIRLLLLFGAAPDESDATGATPLFSAITHSFMKGATLLLMYGADPNYPAGVDRQSPLVRAALSNFTSFTHLLLIYGGEPNHMGSDGNTLLISSINKKSSRKLLELLLLYGADPNNKSREGKTPLFEAIQSAARADIVKTLLEHGANVNLPGPKHVLWPATYQPACLQVLLDHKADYKKCPGIMELATSLNNVDSVRMLLKAGVNPNAKKDGVYTPLCTSIRDNRPDIFELLLGNGADPNVMASEYPAFKCLTHNRLQFLPALVAAGADLHTPKGIVETAVASKNMDGLIWLLDQGLDPNERNPKGCSPLTTAIRDGQMSMVQLLLKRGADPNMRGEDWPICIAVKNPPILKLLLTVLAHPRAFKGVMEIAAAANQLESIKLLLAAGVSVEDKNGGVFSPLTTAIREDRKDIVKFLITEAGADVNAPGEHLPIVKALRRYHEGDNFHIELLLERGADPNKIYRGWNAIMQAVENGNLEVLELLATKSKGIDLDARDELGRNVVEIASSRGWSEAVDVLKKHKL